MIMGIPGNASVQVINVPTEGLAKGRTRGGGAHDKGQPAAQPCQSGCLEIQPTAIKSECVQRSRQQLECEILRVHIEM